MDAANTLVHSINLGMSLLLQDRLNEAKTVFDVAHRLDSTGRSGVSLLLTCHLLGDTSCARETLRVLQPFEGERQLLAEWAALVLLDKRDLAWAKRASRMSVGLRAHSADLADEIGTWIPLAKEAPDA
jgi:Flp pilus assembly protein TadD